MKETCKIALLIALGCASNLSTHAQTAYNNDLIVGFTTGSGNDVVYDLGSPASLTNGETWNLSSLISGFTLSSTRWGVIGSKGPVTGGASLNNQRFVYTTSLTTPPNVTGKAAWTAVDTTAMPYSYQYFPAAGAGNSLTIAATDPASWFTLTTVDGGSTQGFQANYADPNVYGAIAVGFYQAVAIDSTPTNIGTFTLSASKILTYNVVSASVSSTNAYLTSLALSPVLAFSPTFASNVLTSYTATETYGNSPTVTVVNADLTATNRLIYNGTTNLLASGVASSGLALALGGTNVVKVQVTAQDGVTVNMYLVNIIEQPNQLTQPKLTNSVSGGILTMSWATDRLGYRLLVQTNHLNYGISGNTNDWATVAGSTAITTTNIPIVTTNMNCYYRLVYP
jgi:hypothetical protein